MKTWSLALLMLLLGAGRMVADTVELNGITCLFGENMAFLVLPQPLPAKSISFGLSEGESRFGIKLLAVDVVNGRAEIEQSGAIQVLRLGFAPDLTVPVMRVIPGLTAPDRPPVISPLSPEEQLAVNQFLQGDPDAQRIKSGNPVLNIAYVGAPLPAPAAAGAASGSSSSTPPASSPANGSTSANDSSGSPASAAVPSQGVAGTTPDPAATPANNPAPSSDGTSNGKVDYTQEYWYKTSLNIEQNRLATAEQVMSGDSEPLPATPLTPPNTPASLVGPDTYFSNHIPGFVCGGSVDD